MSVQPESILDQALMEGTVTQLRKRPGPRAWICDMDGTVALKGERSPYDWARVGGDAPNEPVMIILHALINYGYRIIFVTGRMEQCRDATREWLNRYQLAAVHLFMRPDDDYRPDEILKREIYETHIKDHFRVAGVLDDRDKVVAMWRSLGLSCLQVAPGNF